MAYERIWVEGYGWKLREIPGEDVLQTLRPEGFVGQINITASTGNIYETPTGGQTEIIGQVPTSQEVLQILPTGEITIAPPAAPIYTPAAPIYTPAAPVYTPAPTPVYTPAAPVYTPASTPVVTTPTTYQNGHAIAGLGIVAILVLGFFGLSRRR